MAVPFHDIGRKIRGGSGRRGGGGAKDISQRERKGEEAEGIYQNYNEDQKQDGGCSLQGSV